MGQLGAGEPRAVEDLFVRHPVSSPAVRNIDRSRLTKRLYLCYSQSDPKGYFHRQETKYAWGFAFYQHTGQIHLEGQA